MARTSRLCHDGSGWCLLLSKMIKPSAVRTSRVRVHCRAEQMAYCCTLWVAGRLTDEFVAGGYILQSWRTSAADQGHFSPSSEFP